MNEPIELDLQDSSSHISSLNKTPASIVQEYAIKNQLTPQYDMIFSGVLDNKIYFRYSLKLDNYLAMGEGSSKKEAKHEAALKLLKQMITDNPQLLITEFKECDFDNHVVSPFDKNIKVNAIGKLNDICANNKLGLPEFKLVREEGLAHAKLFTISCEVCRMIESATHKTKKQAKHLAAVKMVNKLIALDKSFVLEMKNKPNVSDSVKVLEQVESLKKEYVDKFIPKDEYISLYHLMFQRNEWINTTTLINVVEQFCRDGYRVMSNDPMEILNTIAEECGMEITQKMIGKEFVIQQNYYYVFSVENIYPPLSAIGTGDTVDSAQLTAAANLLNSICLLYK